MRAKGRHMAMFIYLPFAANAAPGLGVIRSIPSAEALGFDMSALRACGEDSPPQPKPS
jgi:hypothetical protein